MKRALLNKYFKDECTEKELETVLNWFQTEDGRVFVEQDIRKGKPRNNRKENGFIYRPIDSEKVFNRIQRNKRHYTRKRDRAFLRVASILLLVGLVSFFLYIGLANDADFMESEPSYITYVAHQGQHKIIHLSDGTTISLNEGTKLVVPENFDEGKREIKLTGEAFFEVIHNPDRPFTIHAIGSTIRDLGTKFNVKTDTIAGSVQVAVLEGKVELKKRSTNAPGAILTRNTFGVLDLDKNEITIERMDVSNYLSWLNGRLTFNGQTLTEISQQLEYIYGVNIVFEVRDLKELKLTATFDRESIENTLGIIANTLGIEFVKNDTSYVWSKY